ncbi:MAG: DUF2784 domain-containing protein [Proteobacteria bacterium]|nr:DUF2784 domain-containing protein [Pseudomonadota bacterium]MBU1058162.1 DUF2784 domain-containing protein [Pseudomonadota bacterium]
MSQLLADFLVVLHLAFIIFVMMGGFLVLRWRWIIFLHFPAAVWGALIEFQGWFCPLTSLENYFRQGGGYHAGFISHYILPLVYPSGLTRQLQIFFGIVVLVLNCAVYAWVWRRYYRGRKRTNSSP